MDPIRFAIERPIAVIAAVLMTVLFGLLALTRIPIQLIPDVRKPVIEVETFWAGAAPAEIEREIVNPQEDELKGLDGLESMISRSETGRARITLEFAIGTNMDRSLLLVANRLDRVTGYPAEANEPTLKTSGSDDNPIAWMILKRAPGNTKPIEEYGPFVTDVLKERIERVDGVAGVNIFGGIDRELQVLLDPEKLAAYRLTVPYVLSRLRQESVSLSAGNVDEGKRRYVVRVEGELDTIDAVGAVVLRTGAAPRNPATANLPAEPGAEPGAGRFGRVFVRDVAEIRFGFKEPSARIRHMGEPAIAFNAVRDAGANVITTMEGIKRTLEDLRRGPLKDARLTITQVYDETVYIDGAIDLVVQNIWIGGVLAAIIMLLFLRSIRATLVVSLAIPVSIVASFVAMSAMGRTLNVISLAGIAFAVGMVVDAAIVVLENIYRLRQNGMPAREAAYQGARQVWGAILVSALTTVMVFIPILIMELEAGQLFRDIAVAISVSVMVSLIVAVTVIPALSSRLLGGGKEKLDAAEPAGCRSSGPRFHRARSSLCPPHRRQPHRWPSLRCRHHHRRAVGRQPLPAQARVSARRQPQSRLRRHPAAAWLQPADHHQDRRTHRGRRPPALGKGGNRRPHEPAGHAPFLLRRRPRHHLRRRCRQGPDPRRRIDPGALPPDLL